MGFFSIDSLRAIGERNAFWISRLPASVSRSDHKGIRLGALLKKAGDSHIDCKVLLGRDALPCRLIAIRLDPKRAAANRRHVRSECKRRRVTPNKESLVRAGWRILITNLDAQTLDAKRISDLYALRWSVEIKFRAFKQSCQISRGLKHKSGYHHIEAMVLSAMLYQLLALKLHAMCVGKPEFRGCLSIEKICDAFSIHLMRLGSSQEFLPFDPDPRHLRYERRKRINHWQSIIHSLT